MLCNKQTKLNTAIWLTVVALAVLSWPGAASAQELPMGPEMPGRVEGTGTSFEVTESDYLNITFESSEPVNLVLESVSQMVTMGLEAADGAALTQITLGGFEPDTTYYKYEDDHHNLTEFATNESGSYTYTQDLSERHHVFIQTEPSTIFLSDSGWKDDLGNDPYVGTWDPATQTGTLTQNVSETIQIDSDDITLDGNGYSVTAGYKAIGVLLPERTNVTIKNLNVEGCRTGIMLMYGSNNTLTDNSISSRIYGIYFNSSSNNTLTGNTMSGNLRNLFVYGSYYSDYDHNIDTSNTVEGQPVYYVKNITGTEENPVIFDSSTNAGVFYAFNCQYLIVKDLMLASNNDHGVLFWNTNNSTIENINASNSVVGITIWYSTNNTVTGNTASNNSGRGISVFRSSNSTLTGNIANSNREGITLYSGNDYNTLTDNIVNSNKYGISLSESSYNTLTNNIMSGNNYNFRVEGNRTSDFDNNIDTSNTVEGQPVYYVKNITGTAENPVIYDSSTNAGVFYAINCQYINVKELPLASNNYHGVFFGYTNNSTIENTNASNCYFGIDLKGSSTNILTGNTSANNLFSIRFYYCNNNQIYNNNFIDNYMGALVQYGSGNVFSLDKPTGGNYWSDWCPPLHPDNDSDGFVDDPYLFIGGQDDLPLAWPYVNNEPPVAVCQDVTVMAAGSNCEVVVGPEDVDNGSFDPDGDAITLSLSQEGPYPMGTTTVTLTVTDEHGASSSCDATVQVLTASDGIFHLIAKVMILNLHNGIENSLDAKLENALKALDDLNTNNDVSAINAIEAFINHVQAQSGDKISVADADDLIDTANKIIVGLQNGCY